MLPQALTVFVADEVRSGLNNLRNEVFIKLLAYFCEPVGMRLWVCFSELTYRLRSKLICVTLCVHADVDVSVSSSICLSAHVRSCVMVCLCTYKCSAAPAIITGSGGGGVEVIVRLMLGTEQTKWTEQNSRVKKLSKR